MYWNTCKPNEANQNCIAISNHNLETQLAMSYHFYNTLLLSITPERFGGHDKSTNALINNYQWCNNMINQVNIHHNNEMNIDEYRVIYHYHPSDFSFSMRYSLEYEKTNFLFHLMMNDCCKTLSQEGYCCMWSDRLKENCFSFLIFYFNCNFAHVNC